MEVKTIKSDAGMKDKFVRFGDLFDYENKSKIKAGDGLKSGLYPFYTSSVELTKFVDEFQFNKTSLIFGTGGNASIHYCETPFSVSTDCLVVFAKDETICFPKFVFYYLFGNINLLEEGFKGAGLKHISKAYINDLEIPLPPLATQKRIAEILDAADALRRKDQELLKKYDELAQAIFIDMFGDPVNNEKGWEVKTIEQLVKKTKHSIKRGPFGGALKKEIFVNEGYLVYEQFHALNNDFTFGRYYINQEKYNELVAFDVKPKDIIISCSGIYLGKLAIIPERAKPGIINQALLKLTLDENIYRNEFFVKVFTQENFKEKYFASERGAAIPNFPPMSTFKEFKFICPPIKIQNEYLNLVQNLQNQIDIISKEERRTTNLFQTLLQKAFKGELIA
jgi:type I restriction enzyme, S subunit